MTIRPLKGGYVEPFKFWSDIQRLNLSWMLLNMAINYRFFKFIRPSQLKTIVRLWSSQLSSKVPSTISLATVASLKCLNLLLSSILCPYLFKNLVKKRLILVLRHVNQFLYKCRFRCQDLSIAKEILSPGDFMFTFDLKSGYHHV